MKIVQDEVLSTAQKQSLFQLWNSQYPEKICYHELTEFENYLDGLSNKSHFLLLGEKDEIMGCAFSFIRERKDWFAIIVNSEIQGKGFGTLLLDELKKYKSVLNGWVIDHQNDFKQNKQRYNSPLPFYIKNDFVICKDTRIENEKISAVKIKWERK